MNKNKPFNVKFTAGRFTALALAGVVGALAANHDRLFSSSQQSKQLDTVPDLTPGGVYDGLETQILSLSPQEVADLSLNQYSMYLTSTFTMDEDAGNNLRDFLYTNYTGNSDIAVKVEQFISNRFVQHLAESDLRMAEVLMDKGPAEHSFANMTFDEKAELFGTSLSVYCDAFDLPFPRITMDGDFERLHFYKNSMVVRRSSGYFSSHATDLELDPEIGLNPDSKNSIYVAQVLDTIVEEATHYLFKKAAVSLEYRAKFAELCELSAEEKTQFESLLGVMKYNEQFYTSSKERKDLRVIGQIAYAHQPIERHAKRVKALVSTKLSYFPNMGEITISSVPAIGAFPDMVVDRTDPNFAVHDYSKRNWAIPLNKVLPTADEMLDDLLKQSQQGKSR